MAGKQKQHNEERLTPDGFETWNAYWAAQGMPWRTEPEIDADRQQYLAERRTIQPDIEHRIYPFVGIGLTRADVEWLLATNESKDKQGPVNLTEEQAQWAAVTRLPSSKAVEAIERLKRQRRLGPDLRGAHLGHVNLSGLPLARSGLRHAILSSADLSEAELVEATLVDADLRQATLVRANALQVLLRGADLPGADLSDANLCSAGLEAALLRHATLRAANLENANLVDADLQEADLRKARLNMASFRRANLCSADLTNADAAGADMEDADLTGARGIPHRRRS